MQEAAQTLKVLVEDFENLDTHYAKLVDIEHRGDETVHDILDHMNRSLVTPLDREDIHSLAVILDDVLDYIHGSATRMKIFLIGNTTPRSRELVKVILDSTALIGEAVEMLPAFQDMTPLLKQMKFLEREGDRLNRAAVAELFHHVSDVQEVLNLIKWKEIYESLETVTDKCEDAFDVFQAIFLKHS
jgi:predicted phosphate transport protein (TIGR00153 family)